MSEGGVYATKVCWAGETCIEGSRIWDQKSGSDCFMRD